MTSLAPPPALQRRLLVVTGLVLTSLAAAGAGLLIASWLWWMPAPADDQRSRGVNALWAAHTWVGDPHSDEEYRELALHLQRHEISDMFAHAGPLDGDGTVSNDRTQHARAFITAMERYAPEIRVQAYLGQIEKRDGGPLDLDDPVVRDKIVETAEQFLGLGFDGIHYDIEPIFPGDDSFLDLLERTHAVTEARGAVLSVALEQMELVPGEHRVVGTVWRDHNYPTRDFLQDVADRVDQVAIMAYDTGLPVGWLFGSFAAWQTEHVVEAIGDDVTVFMGVPTYDDGAFLRFHSRAENLRSGIRGVRKGLDQLDGDRAPDVGIAVFAEWTTSEDEWATYRRDWLGE